MRSEVGAGGVVGATYSLLPSTPGDWMPEIDALNRQLGHTPESGGKVTVQTSFMDGGDRADGDPKLGQQLFGSHAELFKR